MEIFVRVAGDPEPRIDGKVERADGQGQILPGAVKGPPTP
jgi:hypothetical protein